MLDLFLQIAPVESVGFDQAASIVGQPQASLECDRAVEDDHKAITPRRSSG